MPIGGDGGFLQATVALESHVVRTRDIDPFDGRSHYVGTGLEPRFAQKPALNGQADRDHTLPKKRVGSILFTIALSI